MKKKEKRILAVLFFFLLSLWIYRPAAASPARVAVSFKDSFSGEQLAGARLSILDEDGRTVADWTSSDEPQLIENLSAGSYTLRELCPPEGFLKAEDKKFTLKDEEALQLVLLYNERKTPKSAAGRGMGDRARTEELLFLMFLSALVLLAMRTLYRNI